MLHVCVHVTRIYSPYRRAVRISTRVEEGFFLSYLFQETSKGIGLERAICAIFEDVFMSILATPAWTFILRLPF